MKQPSVSYLVYASFFLAIFLPLPTQAARARAKVFFSFPNSAPTPTNQPPPPYSPSPPQSPIDNQQSTIQKTPYTCVATPALAPNTQPAYTHSRKDSPMALLKFAPEILGIRGHIAGLIFSANKAGAYIKNFAVPANPNTPAQQIQRSALSIITQTWRALTPSQRTGWDAFAADPPETDYDPWGEVRELTGHQWFVRLNTRLASAGSPPLTNPPFIIPQTPVTITALHAHDPGHPHADSYLSFANGSFSDNSLPVITLALLYSLGLATPTNRFLLAYCGPTTAGSSIPLGTILAAKFGDYSINTQLFATLCRQSVTGIRSTKTTAQTIVIA